MRPNSKTKRINSYAGWTVKKIQAVLSQNHVNWHQGMKKSSLIKLCEDSNLSHSGPQQQQQQQPVVEQGQQQQRGRRRQRGQPVSTQPMLDASPDLIDSTTNSRRRGSAVEEDTPSNTAQNVLSSESENFTASQMRFMERLAQTVANATAQAISNQQKADNAATPQREMD
jgi:hypothetical protein